MNSAPIKDRAHRFGADICRIAPVERFEAAPQGFHPRDIFPESRSVIVFAARTPLGCLRAKTNVPYTFFRNKLLAKMDEIAFHLSRELEAEGMAAVPIPASEPYEYWDDSRRHGRGILSLKHAAVLAGLGTLGKNTLLLNDRFGNMLWLGAVLVDEPLEADALADYDGCPADCTICLDRCPQRALDGRTIDQALCRAFSSTSSPGGETVLRCNFCRIVCPNRTGIRAFSSPLR